MNYLQTLSFSNFQSLKDSKLDLDPGFNVIVGPSNLGKSAAIRALKALVRNASATGLIRQNEKEFKISAVFSDNTIETLTKGKVNQFEIHYPDGSNITHAKAGATAVPEEVDELWNIASPDGRELSFASQHELPFLLNEPASAVARVLGDLTNAARLMEAVQKANKLRTEAVNDEKARTREAEEAAAELERYSDIEIKAKRVASAREAFTLAKDKYLFYKDLMETYDEWQVAAGRVLQLRQELTKHVDVTTQIEAAERAVDTLSKLSKALKSHEDLESQGTTLNEAILLLESQYAQIDSEIHQLLIKSGECPLCGSTIC